MVRRTRWRACRSSRRARAGDRPRRCRIRGPAPPSPGQYATPRRPTAPGVSNFHISFPDLGLERKDVRAARQIHHAVDDERRHLQIRRADVEGPRLAEIGDVGRCDLRQRREPLLARIAAAIRPVLRRQHRSRGAKRQGCRHSAMRVVGPLCRPGATIVLIAVCIAVRGARPSTMLGTALSEVEGRSAPKEIASQPRVFVDIKAQPLAGLLRAGVV